MDDADAAAQNTQQSTHCREKQQGGDNTAIKINRGGE
jgi:hypothetical protein